MIKGILLDMSGVLYIDNNPVPGAINAVQQIRKTGLPVRFVTNTTRTPQVKILARLSDMGFKAVAEEVFTAPVAAKRYLKQHGLSPYLVIHPGLMPEFGEFNKIPYDCVLVGDAADAFTYNNMNEAFRLLLDGASLLAMAKNRYFREGEVFSLDAGPFVDALEYASACEAVILGKPSPDFYNSAVTSMGCKPGEVIMVGDDVEADVLGAMQCGMEGILVRTGKYRSEAEALLTGRARCVDDIGAAVRMILDEK